jgi:tetratricopeptide (TPR) repeat protein
LNVSAPITNYCHQTNITVTFSYKFNHQFKTRELEVIMTLRLFFSFCIALGLAWHQTAFADQDDPRLDELFRALKDTRDVRGASAIEAQIWDIWIEHDNSEYFELMASGIRAMNANALGMALADFNRLIELAPNYAEAWNKRATIYYLLQDYAASAADIDKVLELEPFHFGALSGLGLVRLGQRRFLEARTAFQTVLEVYPAMPGARQNLELLENYLQNNSI